MNNDFHPFYVRVGDSWTQIDYSKHPDEWMRPLVRGEETDLIDIPGSWYLDDLPPMMFIKKRAEQPRLHQAARHRGAVVRPVRLGLSRIRLCGVHHDHPPRRFRAPAGAADAGAGLRLHLQACRRVSSAPSTRLPTISAGAIRGRARRRRSGARALNGVKSDRRLRCARCAACSAVRGTGATAPPRPRLLPNRAEPQTTRSRAPGARAPSQRCSQVSRRRRQGLVGQFVPAHEPHRPHRDRRDDRAKSGAAAERLGGRTMRSARRAISGDARQSRTRTPNNGQVQRTHARQHHHRLSRQRQDDAVAAAAAFAGPARRRRAGQRIRRNRARSSSAAGRGREHAVARQRLPVLRGARRPADGRCAICCPADARRGAVFSPRGDRDSGLADPAPIAYTLLSEAIFATISGLSGIVTTVDAVNGASQLDRFPRSVKQASRWPTGW